MKGEYNGKDKMEEQGVMYRMIRGYFVEQGRTKKDVTRVYPSLLTFFYFE